MKQLLSKSWLAGSLVLCSVALYAQDSAGKMGEGMMMDQQEVIPRTGDVAGKLLENAALPDDAVNQMMPSTQAANMPGFLTSPAEAMKMAQEHNRPILWFFNLGLTESVDADYYNNFLTTPEFKEFAKNNLVLASVDLSGIDNAEKPYRMEYLQLIKKFHVKAIPTIILTTADGKGLGEMKIAATPADYVADLQVIIQPLQWHTDYNQAVKMASDENKKLFILFTGSDWCPYCIKLDQQIISTVEFRKYAQKNLVLVYVDFPSGFQLPKELVEQNEKLQSQYQVKGFPTIIISDSNGRKLGNMGYDPSINNFMQKLEKIAK